MTLAHRLKSSRKRHGLSQTELAEQIQVSQPTIANWERGGHIPRPDALSRIAKALGTDPAWLISGEMPARHNPAHQHLAKPIHHIPVYDWPVDPTDPTETQPARYIVMTADVTNLFALNANFSSGFPDGSILIFSKTDQRTPGRFLEKDADGYTLTESPLLENNVFARLVYSVVPH